MTSPADQRALHMLGVKAYRKAQERKRYRQQCLENHAKKTESEKS